MTNAEVIIDLWYSKTRTCIFTHPNFIDKSLLISDVEELFDGVIQYCK